MPNVERAPLTRADLDKLSCQSPGCTHKSHDGLVLNGRCHVGTPTTTRFWASGLIEVRCLKCDRWISDVALDAKESAAANEILACTDPNCKESPESHSLVFRPPCHRKAGVFVTYQDGHLLITCGKCKKPVGAHHAAEGSASS